MDQHQRGEQQQDQHLPLNKGEQDGSLRTCKEQLRGPDALHTTNLGEKTSSVQLQCSLACSVPSASVGLSEALPVVAHGWTFQNGGDATPMRSPGGGGLSSSMHKTGRGRPRKEDQQSQVPAPPTASSTGGIKRGRGRPRKEDQQSQPTPPPPPTASRRGVKVGCGRPMLASTSGEDGINTGPPRRPIIIEKLPAAWWSVNAASTGIKRPRGRPRKERPDAVSSGIKRGGGQLESEMEMLAAAAAAMMSETGDDALPTGTKGAVENPRSVDAVSTGTERALENPSPRTEKPSAGDIVSMVMKRGPGRPRKDQQSKAPTTPTASTGGIKRGRGRPRKDQQSQALTTPTTLSTDGINRGRGRARKEQQSQAAKPPPTPTASRRGIKVGCGRPMIIEKPPVARWSIDAALTGIKRPRGRPRKETPSVAMSVETGYATPAPETGDAVPAEAGDAASAVIKRGRGRPRKERPDAALAGIKRGMSAEDGDATPAPETERATTTATKRPRGRPRKERPDAALSGIKRGRGRPRKEKPAAAMSAEAGDAAASMGFKRWGGQREPGMDMLAAAAAMLAESGDDAVATGGSKGAVEDPRNPRMAKASSAGDIVWMVMNRGGPRKEQPPGPGPGFGSWFGDMAEASCRSKQQEEARGWKTTSTRVEEEEKAGCVAVSVGCATETNLGSAAENAKASAPVGWRHN